MRSIGCICCAGCGNYRGHGPLLQRFSWFVPLINVRPSLPSPVGERHALDRVHLLRRVWQLSPAWPAAAGEGVGGRLRHNISATVRAALLLPLATLMISGF